MSKLNFKSEITANDAMVIPMAKEPEFPTKIFPLKLKYANTSQNSKGPTIRMYDDERAIKPIITIAGHIVSKPFNPPSMFTEFVTIITITGIIT